MAFINLPHSNYQILKTSTHDKLKDNYSTIVSKFDAIYSSIVSYESMVIAAFYNKGQNKHIEIKEKLWLHIEKKIVNVYSNNDETKANVLKPYLLTHYNLCFRV